MVRAFLALELNEPPVTNNLREVQSQLLSSGVKLRPIPPEQIHLTIKFFDETSEEQVKTVVDSLRPLNHPQFTAVLKSLGAFPSPGRARVVWVGFDDSSSRSLMELESKIHKLLVSKVWFDPKPFRAHITIARVKQFAPTSQLADLIRKLEGKEFGQIQVSKVKLKKSVLTPQGPVYSDLHTFRLGDRG